MGLVGSTSIGRQGRIRLPVSGGGGFVPPVVVPLDIGYVDTVVMTGTGIVKPSRCFLVAYRCTSGSVTVNLYDGASSQTVANQLMPPALVLVSGDSFTYSPPLSLTNGLMITVTGTGTVEFDVQ